MYCAKCGCELSDNVKFCQNCGSLVNSNIKPKENSDNTIKKKVAELGYSVFSVNKFRKITSVIISVICVIVIVNTVDIKAIFNGFKGILTENNNEHHVGQSKTGLLDSINSSLNAEPAIKISDISFDPSIFSITYKFENISENDIAYIYFDTYFYDRMGSALMPDFSTEYGITLKYTGPLYKGDTDSAYWNYLYNIPTETSVVYPKKIKVVFTDDKEITFENTVYYHSDDFYGGELKDSK